MGTVLRMKRRAPTLPNTTQAERRLDLALALKSDSDVRTARRARREGIDHIKGHALRDRLAIAAKELGIVLPSPAGATRKHAA